MRSPTNCTGCFHNIGMGVCNAKPEECKNDGYSGYRFRDFVAVAEFTTKNNIRCFYASLDEDGGVRLEVY